MKENNYFWKVLINPFRFVAGGKALFFGFLVMALLVVLAFLADIGFDGVLDMHYGCGEREKSFLPHIYCIFGSWIIAVAVFYVTALIAAGKKVRIVDIAGTFALAKTPLLINALLAFLPVAKIMCGMDLTNISSPETMQQLMLTLLKVSPLLIVNVIILIWYIVLMYNAYSVSANIKGAKGILTFIAALLVSEILSKVFLVFVL
ncbi:MAG: YIP1 family protein [Dysgonamonadaceae bacterium]|nr:YIP1 family protein [Dysgonamonadaceae bacterium]